MGQVKDVLIMLIKKKTRSVIAAIIAVMTALVNTVVAVAAPYGYSSVDDIRNKALNKYLSANTVISAVNTKAPTVIDDVIKAASSEVLVAYNEVVETQEIGYNTIKRLNNSLNAGSTEVVREGEMGEKTFKYRVKYENGEEVSRELIEANVTKNPVDKIVEYGNTVEVNTTTATPSAASAKLNYKYVIECNATAYDLSAEENGGYAGQTATGVPLDKGVIAVDPRVIPLGSRVYIEALDGSWTYGYAVAADTGGAIKGNRVDLCYRTRSECIQFGRRKCRVYVLN